MERLSRRRQRQPTCLGVPLPDTDGDGVCDATDPCATGGAIDAFVFSSGKFDTPAGDDRLTARGRLTIAAGGPPLDPATTGIRLIVEDANGTYADVTVPSGAYDPAARAGWKTATNGRRFTYRTRTPAGAVPINAATLGLDPTGRVKFSIGATHGTFATVQPAFPMAFIVILDPTMSGGRCGKVRPACLSHVHAPSVRTVTCR